MSWRGFLCQCHRTPRERVTLTQSYLTKHSQMFQLTLWHKTMTLTDGRAGYILSGEMDTRGGRGPTRWFT